MKDFLNYCSECYYNGHPIISDVEFDILWAEYGSDSVGHTVTDGTAHWFQMYSLQKVFTLDHYSDLHKYTRTPKLDGAAISILYVSGQLVLGLTRGDGKLGRDITDKVKHLVPNTLDKKEIIQVTGEVVCPSNIPNSRNLASGSLNLKDESEFLSRPLTFVAYDIQAEHDLFSYFTEGLTYLESQGFNIVTTFNASEYPTDGEVFRIENNALFKSMGHTSHHPRGAFALKQQQQGIVTTLLDVTWQVGKSGVVSPVAILDPIKIGDAAVSRATLHNMEYINALDLEIGCQVEVIRSGEIIPRILKRVYS